MKWATRSFIKDFIMLSEYELELDKYLAWSLWCCIYSPHKPRSYIRFSVPASQRCTRPHQPLCVSFLTRTKLTEIKPGCCRKYNIPTSQHWYKKKGIRRISPTTWNNKILDEYDKYIINLRRWVINVGLELWGKAHHLPDSPCNSTFIRKCHSLRCLQTDGFSL